MYREILKHYLLPAESHFVMPLAVDVVELDYYLYLIANRAGQWFAIAQADYMPGLQIVDDVEAAFPVKVLGWRPHHEGQARTSNILPPGTVMMSTAGDWSKEDWDTFNKVTIQNEDGVFALLAVEPAEGASYADFGLTFYE